MEDFDYIDALAKSELSNRTVTPSADGWNVVQQKMKRKKRKRRIAYLFLIALLGSLSIYIGVNITSGIEESTVSDKNIEQFKSTNQQNKNTIVNSDSTSNSIPDSNLSSNSTSTLIANDDISQAGTNTSGTHSVITAKNKYQTTNKVHGNGNDVVQKQTGNHSRFNNKESDSQLTSVSEVKSNATSETPLNKQNNIVVIDDEENFSLNTAGLKLYDWKLISPDQLEKKRKKRKKSKKKDEVYENLDVMIGLNGFVSSQDDYKLTGSYVVALSYTDEKKLKNDFYFKYGANLQFRNLRLKNDSLSFNKGELSMNLLSSVEKRFGNFGIEAGAYAGYEFYSPNNDRFADSNTNFFEQKINYGFLAAFNYNKIGLIFRYELSPYINYLGNKKFGAFTVGVKYDF
ncbi:hypothetical protein [Kordia sp.]|uniref:hypothetical protein n=1 Tax=Kordia sp. TaxID=1965332 RepID=UPI003B5C6B9D